ncbi:MAG: hypothetical protein ACFFKA_20110 [Candidatus Thorarchaeota archaeon]
MKKIKRKKQMKTDEWNERSINREENQTQEEDIDWNKKNEEDEERDENEDEFHEGDYDT